VLATSIVATVVLGYFASTLKINFTLDRLRAVTPGARAIEDVSRAFNLPGDVLVVLANGPDLQRLLEANEQLAQGIRQQMAALDFQAPATLLPSAATQQRRRQQIRERIDDVDAVVARIENASAQAGFKPNTFDPFTRRLPYLLDTNDHITWEQFAAHDLEDVIGRFVTRDESGWWLATYAFPTGREQIESLQAIVAATPGAGRLTGLPIVNQELSKGFVPQFALGLTLGTVIVLGSIVLTFRSLRLSLLTLVPTAIGLTWAAGLLALAGAELDLFSVFAVITFVGIGVDYGIHLVHRYQERGNAAAAIAELAPVILVAGAITLFGYGTLIGSSYPPLQSIGVVSAVSVMTLIVASVLVLPAMLQRPRGAQRNDSGAPWNSR
jgi:predicted RND superfamily exporter protein